MMLEEFESDLDASLLEYERLIEGSAARTRPMLDRWGYVEATRRLVESGELQAGFIALRDAGLLNLAFEQLVLEYDALFLKRTVEAARFRLENAHRLR